MGRGGVEYVLCLETKGSQIRIYLKLLQSDFGQVAQLQLSSACEYSGAVCVAFEWKFVDYTLQLQWIGFLEDSRSITDAL